MSIKDQIRAEIERLFDGEAPMHDQQCNFDSGYFAGIGAISKFLDTLPEQPVEGLEEAAEYCADLMCAELYATFNTRYDKKEKCLISKLTSGDVANIKEFGYKLFKAGAEWHAKHLKSNPL